MDRAEYARGGIICPHCDKLEDGNFMRANEACGNCLFWVKYMKEDKERTHECFITETFNHYAVGKNTPGGDPKVLGFYGRVAEVTFPDGHTEMTNNLWYQGEIPERFRGKWPISPSKLEWKD